MEKRKEKEVTKVSEVVVAYVCDVCGKEEECSDIPKHWHHMDVHRGYNSYDNTREYESYDVCSAECYISQLKESVQEGYFETIDELSKEFVIKLAEKL